MKICLLSSVYPAYYSPKGTTPVVHYFAKEWQNDGNEVHVFHLASCFPKCFYYLSRPFKSILDSLLGHLMPSASPVEYDEVIDGVHITHINLRKTKPHGRFNKKQIARSIRIISSYIQKEGVPDVFVGHWDNPQLELLSCLKEQFCKPTCLVHHFNSFDYLLRLYGKDTENLIGNIDLVGFRSITAQAKYEVVFGKPEHSFICASGVSRQFIDEGDSFDRVFSSIQSFTFVGSLISRKHPASVMDALAQSFGQEHFVITYIGEGNEKKHIQRLYKTYSCKADLVFTGRIPREAVIRFLKETDVFVMISEDEVFGLVYLEAMALGCITIAARHEGIDGIIQDGVNGFLCEAGNVVELTSIIERIRSMKVEDLTRMSVNAKETANAFTDKKVAENYLNSLKRIAI